MLKPFHALIAFSSFGLLLLFPVAPCAGQVLNGTTLTVSGNASANTIRFSIDGDEVVAVVDGAESRFDLAQVDELTVFAGTGDDTVINNTHIKMSVSGGAGDDYIVGGSGDDELDGQTDDDTIFGRDGQDRLDGGGGTDFLAGGNGDDQLSATGNVGLTSDVMFGGAGDDVLSSGLEMSGGPGDDVINSRGNNIDGLVISGNAGNDELNFQNDANLTTVDGGPDADLINGSLLEFGVFVSRGGAIFATGSAEDDSMSLTLEAGMLVVRVENANAASQEIVDPAGVTAAVLRGLEGDDMLVNSSNTSAVLFDGPGDDFSMTNTDLDQCVNNNEGGNDVYDLHGGSVFKRVTLESDPDFDAITVVGSERDEEVTFLSFFGDSVVTGVSQINLGAGDDLYRGWQIKVNLVYRRPSCLAGLCVDEQAINAGQ